MDPARQLVEAACFGNGNYPENRQTDSRQDKAQQGRPDERASLLPKVWRENQIACSKKHGE